MRPVLLLLVAAVVTLTGCASQTATGAPISSPAPLPAATPVPAVTPASGTGNPDAERVAVVGDSITTVYSPDFPRGHLDPTSWVNRILDEDHVFAGGWAVRGASTEAMADAVVPLDADTLILLAGTNDLRLGVPFRTSAANLADIAQTVGAERVVVSAIPPYERIPGASEKYNERLEALAAERGWDFVEPARGLAQGGRFQAGMTDDGVHPTAEGSRLLGEAMREAVWPVLDAFVDAAA